MSSSISSSNPWRRTLLWFAGSALAGFAGLYLFVAIIDPWNVLPLSPPLPRVPITGNARFSMPALARSQRFDSAVIGTSSSRLLRPERLDVLLGGHFVNLAMNASTAWEQAQILRVFTAAHPDARMVLIGVDRSWCTETPDRLTGRPFPAWMYDGSPWRGYREIANVFAVQEAVKQFAVMIGVKRPPYGLDGYTSFVPDESEYDTKRVAAAFVRWGVPPDTPAMDRNHVLPALPMLAEALRALPAGTRKVVFFTPSSIEQQGVPGSDFAAMLETCKTEVAALTRGVPGAVVVDFLIPSPITLNPASYWDPVHYRIPTADRLMNDMAAALAGRTTADAMILR